MDQRTVRQVKVADIKQGDSVALPISQQQYDSLSEDNVIKKVTLVEVYDVMSIVDLKASKSRVLELLSEHSKDGVPVAQVYKADLNINLLNDGKPIPRKQEKESK